MRRKEIILAGILFGFLSLIAYPVKNVWAVCRDTGRELRGVEATISWYRSDSDTVCRAGVTIAGEAFRLEFAAPLDNEPIYNEINRSVSCEAVLQAKIANRKMHLQLGKVFDCDGIPFLRNSWIGYGIGTFSQIADSYTDPTGGRDPGNPVDFLANVAAFRMQLTGCETIFHRPNSQEGLRTLIRFLNNADVALAWRLRQTTIQQCSMISTAYFRNIPLHVRGWIERKVDGIHRTIPDIEVGNLKMD